MSDTEDGTPPSLLRPIVCLGLAWAVVLVSLAIEIAVGGNWLARSGSLMVLFSVITGYILLGERDTYHSQTLKRHWGKETVDFSKIHPSPLHRKLETVSHLTVVIGTVIWGYGDLFIAR
jgi:hypothetical protein